MTIRTKIIVFQVFFVGLLLMLAGVVYLAVHRTDRFTERVQHAHRQLVTITALSLHANQYSEQIAEMLLFGEEGRADLEEARRQVERSFQALEGIIRYAKTHPGVWFATRRQIAEWWLSRRRAGA